MHSYDELSRSARHRRRQRAAVLGVSVEAVPDGRGRHGCHAAGADHGKWNEGRMISSHGYVKIRVGVEHPLADANGYAYEHLLVWVAAGRALPKAGELLHHDNEDKQDNRLGNLVLKTNASHAFGHIMRRRRDPVGRLLPKEG